MGRRLVGTSPTGRYAGNWVSRDPGAAIDYAQTISDGSLRDGFVQSAMNRFATMDPMAAANWLSSDAARPHASSLVGSVSSRWANFDPGSTAAARTFVLSSTAMPANLRERLLR